MSLKAWPLAGDQWVLFVPHWGCSLGLGSAARKAQGQAENPQGFSIWSQGNSSLHLAEVGREKRDHDSRSGSLIWWLHSKRVVRNKQTTGLCLN